MKGRTVIVTQRVVFFSLRVYLARENEIEEEMKTILTILLILTAQNALSTPTKIYSQVCGQKYTEGLIVTMANGRVIKECLNKKVLPSVYPAWSGAACADSHIDGEQLFDDHGNIYKLCLSKAHLREVYPTHKKFECANGYKANSTTSFNLDDLESKFCIRELI